MTALDEERPIALEDREAARLLAERFGWRHRHSHHEIVDQWKGHAIRQRAGPVGATRR